MNARALYSASQNMQKAVRDTANKIIAAFEQPMRLVEYITLPDFGQRIILRFRLVGNQLLLNEEVDSLESRMRTLAGSDYWVTLTVNSYEAVEDKLRQQLTAIDRAVSASILQYNPTSHIEKIGQDAPIIRRALHLPEEFLIWEFEIPISDTSALPAIRIIDTFEEGDGLSSRQKSGPATVDDIHCTVVYLKNNPSFTGCLKAYFAAQQQQKALANFISQFQHVEITVTVVIRCSTSPTLYNIIRMGTACRAQHVQLSTIPGGRGIPTR